MSSTLGRANQFPARLAAPQSKSRGQEGLPLLGIAEMEVEDLTAVSKKNATAVSLSHF